MYKLKQIVSSNAPLKIISFIIGYTFWYIFGHAQTITTELNVPLCFYATQKNLHIQAPDMIHIELSGKRAIMNTLDLKNLAIHIDARELITGMQPLDITQERLFLPDSIKLVHYKPSQIMVTVEQSEITPENKTIS